MTKKASSAAEMAADIFKKTALLSEGGVAFATRLLLILMGFFLPVGLSAQECQPNDPANFNFTVPSQFSCEVDFTSLYAGGGTVTHEWRFYEQPTATGPFSTSNLANPLHTFDALSQTRLVVHTITITQNGQVTTHTCSRIVNTNCDGCNESGRRFTYAVNGCTVTFTALNTNEPATWTFGDGFTATGNPVTHIYGGNGDFTVILAQNGFTCSKRIRTFCGAMACCNANFSARVNLECATLCLNLEADCAEDGQHTWAVTSNGCLTLPPKIGKTANIACVQLTNINTVNTPSVTVTHTFTCPNGATQTVTQTVGVPFEGIFIGERGVARDLSLYECVLPGSSYAGNLPVYMSGKITVNKKSFTFSGTEIFVEPGDVGFDVPSSRSLTLRQNSPTDRTTMRSAPGCNCLWRGNDALAGGNITTNGAVIEDAAFALRAWSKCTLSVTLTDFNRDFVGIRATNGAFTLAKFERNVFDGAGPLREVCTLLPRIAEIIRPSGVAVNYSTARGYAGMYVDNIGTLNLLPLTPLQRQNTFRNLAMGIQAFNTNLRVERNSRFFNIELGGYAYSSLLDAAAAVRMVDSPVAGSNSCRVVGNITSPIPPVPAVVDFDNCATGVYVSSSVQADGAAGTRVHIASCRMTNMQHGIMMLTGDPSGTLAGGGNGFFRGIFSNNITSNRVFAPLIDLTNSGITIFEQSPTISTLQIYRNTISVSGTADLSPAYGIRVGGGTQNHPPVAQIDIHRNTVNVGENAWDGIRVANYSGAWVHDNSAAASLGAGIFMNSGGTFNISGINISGGGENMIACNDITATGNTQITESLMISKHEDGTFARNHLQSNSPLLGGLMQFNANNGLSTTFLRNTLQGNGGTGLEYVDAAQTGPQGVQGGATNGNRWLGTFNRDAENLGPINMSRYYVRGNFPDESPAVVVSLPGWFSPNATLEAPQFPCPVTAPLLPPPAAVNGQEEQVADGTAQYSHYPVAYTWWNEHNLYRKLLRYPALRQGNTLMQNFFGAKSGTSLGKLVNAVSASDSLFAVSSTQQNNIESLQGSMDVLEGQIAVLDSMIYETGDSLTIAPLLVQREQKMDTLAVQQSAAQTLFQQIEQQRILAAPAVLTSIDAVTTSNAFETNLKTTLRIFVRFAALGIQPSATELSDLSSIGSGCPFVVGPAKYTAHTLYDRFTGINLPETQCPPGFTDPGGEDRSQRLQGSTGFALYPNPATDRLEVRYDAPGAASLSMQNAMGQQVLRVAVQASGQAVDISMLAPGCYFVRLEQEGKAALAQPLIIHQ